MTRATEGFSLVEVVVALLILSVGLLAMAGTTGAIFTQIRVAERRTERVSAVQAAIEEVRTSAWTNLPTACTNLNRQIGQYTITCSSTLPATNLVRLNFISTGPSYSSGSGWQMNVADTFQIQIAR
ncbi:MAG: type IV pilus modification PilV family protein [Longimicrobiales bacterium]